MMNAKNIASKKTKQNKEQDGKQRERGGRGMPVITSP